MEFFMCKPQKIKVRVFYPIEKKISQKNPLTPFDNLSDENAPKFHELEK